MSWWRRRREQKDFEIAPDEIFLDDANVSEFDRARFEGRLERPLNRSTFLVAGVSIGLFFVTLLAQSWNLQVRQGAAYAAESERNSLEEQMLFAERGIITDVNGAPLVTNETNADGLVRRVYRTPGLSSVLGYVSYPKKDSSGNYYSTETKGLAGLEASYDSLLNGKNGTLLIEKDAVGEVKSQGTIVPPQNGTSLQLSLDVRVQDAFYKAIKELADRVPFAGGAGILMDVKTGELKAMVSYPEFDSNVLSAGSPAEVIRGYSTDTRRPYLNRNIQGLYTPGSVVKPLEAAAALTEGTITADYTINDTGSISIPNPYNPDAPNVFVDWKVLGTEDLRRAIAFSSDVYFYIVGGGYQGKPGLGIERLASWYRTFGLTSPTGITFPGERIGFVPTPDWKQATFKEAWNIGDTYHTAIGQYAMQVTPLAQARAIAAIANGGTLVTPTIVKNLSSRAPDAPVLGTALPLTKDSIKVAQEGMRQGVREGTSVGLSSLEYFVHLAGKTGTAQTGVRNEFHNSWAVGFFPYENPKYVYLVMMERGPSTNVFGGVYVMSQVLSELHQTAPEYFE
ncbi:MAG TPA: penicillin-binding transpeptidase domain-containing protein [Candidatus Paceibacterota bacterium]|nr:penicillin-binding transpeptidase domain-containing protein [Candidatus Paceibacterota bacterium]